MLIYGRSKWKLIRSETLYTEKCSHCNTSGNVDIQVYSKYAHVFWIPFCPLPKEILSICGHCKQVQTAKEMPPHVRDAANNLKKEAKLPIYYWAGAALLLLLIIAVTRSSIEDGKRNTAFAAAPKVGDIYDIKLADGSYTKYKVSATNQDTILFAVNQYQVNKSIGLSKSEFDAPNSYIDIDTPITINAIKTMLSKGDILNIKRNN